MKHHKVLTTTAVSLIITLILAKGVIGVTVGNSLLSRLEIRNLEPHIWSCGERIIIDDGTETGRISEDGKELIERGERKYLFEGERIKWDILVMDLNGARDIENVYVTVGPVRGEGNDIVANCQIISEPVRDLDSCNANIESYEIIEYD